MKNSPLVSVVIPTRNRKDLLKCALKSIQEQSYQNLQIIVQDNNTPNLSEEDVNPYDDNRVEFYKSSIDIGMLENWQSGLSRVRGDLFLRFDDDNILAEQYIENVVKCFDKYKPRMITANCLTVNNNRKLYTLVPDTDKIRSLTKDQLMYLTFHNYIDSNYSVYDFKYLTTVFGQNNIYETNLPDRYLDLRLANRFKTGDAIFIETISGITRLDYRIPNFDTSLGTLSFRDIISLRSSDEMSQLSPHTNFTTSRFFMFLRYYNSGVVGKEHFFNRLISFPILEIELLIGNFSNISKGISSLCLFYVQLVSWILKRPFSYYSTKSIPSIFVLVTKIFIAALFRTINVRRRCQSTDYDIHYWSKRMRCLSFKDFVREYKSHSYSLYQISQFDGTV